MSLTGTAGVASPAEAAAGGGGGWRWWSSCSRAFGWRPESVRRHRAPRLGSGGVGDRAAGGG